MFKDKWLNLQLFAGEGAGDGGGEGAATGENNAAAGHQRLLELGVPEDKIRKNRAYKLKGTAPKAAEEQPKAQEPKAQQAAAATDPTEEKTDATPTRKSFKELLEDPEYNREMQAIVQSRLRGAKDAEANLAKLAPALEVLARQYGLDMENIDYDALSKAINKDQTYYEDLALARGERIEKTMEDDQQKRDTARQQREDARTLEDQKLEQHILKIQQQGEEMKKVFPNFDLRKELQDPRFARMTSPNVGISVQDAYYAIHRNEIQAAAMQVTAQKTAQKISNDIQAGRRRPSENGTSGQAPSVTTFDYRSMSPEQRKSLKDRIRSGEKIYPGQV